MSKSAADEWPSSEDDDESVSIDKKKLNLSKMIASKKGKAEQGKGKHSEQPSSSKTRSDSQEDSAAEDSEEDDGEEEEEEEEDDDDEDNDEDEEEDEDEDEEEDEDDDDDDEDEDDEESQEEEGEENEEENGSVEDEDDQCVATVKANTTVFDDVQKPSVNGALEIIDSADGQNMHDTGISDSGTLLDVVCENPDSSEKDAKIETQNTDLLCPAEAMPATLNVVEDCVVSAIRVESKFSDEDESLGKECLGSIDQNIISNQSSTGGPVPTQSHIKEEEIEREAEKDHDDSWSDRQNSGDTVWNDSDTEEDNQTGGFGRNTLLANQRYVLPEVDMKNPDSLSDGEDDTGSNKKAEKRRSSWGSSLEDNDSDKENEVNSEILDQTNNAKAPDLQPEATSLHSKITTPQPNEDPRDTSWDSSSPVPPSPKCNSPKQVIDNQKSFLGKCLTSSPQPKNKPGRVTADESEWDSSENKDQNDSSPNSKCEVVSPISKPKVIAANQTREQQGHDKESIEKESNDPSPAVSPIADNVNVESAGQLSQMSGKLDSENENSDSSWDDEDESDESEKQKTKKMKDDEDKNCGNAFTTVLSDPTNLSRPISAIDKKEAKIEDNQSDEGNEVVPHSVVDGSDESAKDIEPDEDKQDDETSEDSDSMDQKLQYDFASATVKVCDDEHEARLTAYAPLENISAIATRTKVSSDDLNEEPIREKSPPTKDDVTAGHHTLSDEMLPQTDIDDVDLDSPDEAENTGMGWPEQKGIPEPEIKKEDSTEDGDDDDKEAEQDEAEEGDISDEDGQPEESGESLDAASTVPETQVSKDNERDFRSELGLEKGEDEQDSWDSESHSDHSNIPHEQKQNLQTQEAMSTAEEEIKEIGNNSNDDNRGEEDVIKRKENEKAKWEPLSVLSKLEGDANRQKDLMEELGLGDVDDLEDASDWDSASTTSKRTLPGRRMTSPELEESPKFSNSPVKEQDEDVAPTAALTPQRSISSDKKLPSTPSRSVPHPQPRARKMVLQKPESEEESDWEPDKITSPFNETQPDNELQNIAALPEMSEPGSPELLQMAKESESGIEVDEQQQQASKDTTTTTMQVQKSSASWDTGHTALEEVGTEKPETRLGSLSTQTGAAIHQEQLPVAAKRLPPSGQQKSKNTEEVEMAEDFDELTQSSDTATDDIDSPTSGYRHASLLIQKLDSATLDSRSMVKLQNIFHEYERSIQKARSRHGYLADKVNQLEVERAEMKSCMEEVKDVKSALERNQLELQTEVTNLKFQLKQEQENRRNATMMYNTTRDKLRRTEEQHQLEVQERQKVELTLRNLELEMRTLVNNMKQLEEDHSETQRLLAQERSARTLQENLLNSHLRKQQEIEEESKRNMSKSNEALSQLTEASDRERELVQQTATLQEQLTILRTDIERLQANSSLKESHLTEENEALKEQLEDVRRDLKLNSEALTQTVFSCNNQLTTLKSELAITTTRMENERQTRETLEAEVESTRTRLAGAVKEAELCRAAHTDTEKALLREKEEHQRLKDRLTGEAASQRQTVSSLSQKLAQAESQNNSMENEVHQVRLQLTEKGVLLEVLQREKNQAAARVKELETALQAERELVSRAGARQEATQERLAQAQSESMLLRQQLEEAQNKGVAKERAVTDAQERFSDILSKLRSDCEERVQLVEDRNKELASKAADLRDQIYKLEEEKNERETSLRQRQQELADSLKKLSMSEASLEVNTRYRNDLEEEKARLFKDLDRLKGKLEESEDQYVQAERHINSLKSSLDEREKELTTAAQKHQEALFASAASDITIKQLEEAVQRLEIDNARLEAAAKQQSNKIEALQKGAQEAVMVRGHLEELVSTLQSSKMTLEDQLSREVQKQSVLSHTAQDSQALWEEELKSRSKLGLRLAELEKEKGELNTQMEMEKKKVKKIAEQKKAVDARLDQEMKRNTDLQKEMYR
uniref:CCDC144C-like coiled-coil domain-containing protein n=1 Tax=Amphiprion percula TaxID=161767 RepID=A0A3P8S8R7_AMPPE